MDPWQQSADRGVAETVALEMLQRDAPIEQRAREAVLHAELGIEFAVRIGPVGVRQSPWMGPRVDTLHHRRGQFVFAYQRQHRIHRRMRTAAAGILLDRNARLHDVPRLTPVTRDRIRIEIAHAVEHVQEPLFVFQRTRIGGEPICRQQRRKHAVARRMSDMQRLGHCAKVGLHTG